MPKSSRKSTAAAAESARVSFNWGYHDGRADRAAGATRRMFETFVQAGDEFMPVVRELDANYYAGYVAGARERAYTENSDVAWEAHCAA